MLTHGELKVRFLNRSEKDLSSDVYFYLSSFYGFLFMKYLKKSCHDTLKSSNPPPPLTDLHGTIGPIRIIELFNDQVIKNPCLPLWMFDPP